MSQICLGVHVIIVVVSYVRVWLALRLKPRDGLGEAVIASADAMLMIHAFGWI